ncbi:helix-turn-helix transcriptional regulator [Cnuibacter physcomitrellae]|uniref:helix-turn-helix transcriptional regulator n=1 Tax=Cnuibacter physcomitrellae TaxID=1619308 RepID=UPI002175C368|nr:helix-turn-helix transcriptional regulator [Cnuibacter physcomitrellae]MCS5498339.1 helix-turn-helix transcriptional regulator [Cnuibacter physcomitrellae]
METRPEIREFLTSRRARITPEQAKLPVYGGNRRVTGLRREEVAMLAGMSVDYYTKLERGTIGAVSESVLDAVARALQLTRAERDHLFRLVGTGSTLRSAAPRAPRRMARPTVQRVLDSMTDSPAFVGTSSRHLIAANALGRAVFSPLYESPTAREGVPNTALFLFLDPSAAQFFPEWPKNAADSVANIRTELGVDPHDEALTGLVDELNRESAEFRRLWRSHDVRYHDTGFKNLHHPVVGDLHLTFEVMGLPADPGQNLIVYGAEPASATADALRLLASWAADPRSSATLAEGEGAS